MIRRLFVRRKKQRDPVMAGFNHRAQLAEIRARLNHSNDNLFDRIRWGNVLSLLGLIAGLLLFWFFAARGAWETFT